MDALDVAGCGGATRVSKHDRGRAMQVATCAVLLEAAMADNELSGEELDHIYTALQHLYHMDRSDIDQLLEMTRLFVGRARGTSPSR